MKQKLEQKTAKQVQKTSDLFNALRDAGVLARMVTELNGYIELQKLNSEQICILFKDFGFTGYQDNLINSLFRLKHPALVTHKEQLLELCINQYNLQAMNDFYAGKVIGVNFDQPELTLEDCVELELAGDTTIDISCNVDL